MEQTPYFCAYEYENWRGLTCERSTEKLPSSSIKFARAFKIVYDSTDPLYEPKNKQFSSVTERSYIEGVYYALIANAWELAEEL